MSAEMDAAIRSAYAIGYRAGHQDTLNRDVDHDVLLFEREPQVSA